MKLLLLVALGVAVAGWGCESPSEAEPDAPPSASPDEGPGASGQPNLGQSKEGASFVFLIDTSASMGALVGDEDKGGVTRLDVAKSEVTQAIAELPAGALFDVAAFDCEGSAFAAEPVQATADTAEDAVRWVEALNAHATSGNGTGPAVVWSLDLIPDAALTLYTGELPSCDAGDWSYGSAEAHAKAISAANSGGKTIHVVLINPSAQNMVSFGEAVAGETGSVVIK